MPKLNSGNGPADSPVETARNYAEISASTANSKATLKVATDYAPPAQRSLPDFMTFSGSVSTPLGNGNSNAQLATLDGLSDSTNLTLKLVGFWAHTRTTTAEENAHYCGEIGQAAQNAETLKRPDPVDLKRCNSKSGLEKTCGEGKKLCCNNSNADLLSCMGFLPRTEAEAFKHHFWVSPVSWSLGSSLTVGTKTYKFLDSITTANSKKTQTPWSAQIFGAFQWSQNLITAGARYQVSYMDATAGGLCPAPTSYPVKCKSGPIGAPIKTEAPIPYLEFRRRIGGLAIDPSLNYDLKKSVVGASLPIYFVGDTDNKLTGGVSVGWRSDQGGAQFGLFVGSAFSLSPSQ